MLSDSQQKPLIVAHRGWKAIAPENTMAAFRLAIEHGADGIELDAFITKDGQIAICHDMTLERTTNGNGVTADHTLEELQRLDAGSWFSPEFSGERIPSLDELLNYIATNNWRGLINIHINLTHTIIPGLEAGIVKLVQRYGLASQCILSAFNHNSIAIVRDLDPDIPIAPLYSIALYQPWDYAKRMGCSALHPRFTVTYPEDVKQAQAHGLKVNTWTVNDPAQYRHFAGLGVDAIITDHVDIAAQAAAV